MGETKRINYPRFRWSIIKENDEIDNFGYASANVDGEQENVDGKDAIVNPHRRTE